jgi:hypothetical protein
VNATQLESTILPIVSRLNRRLRNSVRQCGGVVAKESRVMEEMPADDMSARNEEQQSKSK